MELKDLPGTELENRTIEYSEFDAILYALSVGAKSADLSLVYERDLHVLPTYALALTAWVPQVAAELEVYDRNTTLHASQSLKMKAPMPKKAKFEVQPVIVDVWDKGRAAMVDIEASSEYFDATFSIYVPNRGGWGGDRGPAGVKVPEIGDEAQVVEYQTSEDLAALYRLTGDDHPIHIDPELGRKAGLGGPILHGLCTLGVAARQIAETAGANPWDLTSIEAKFSLPVKPGDRLVTRSVNDGDNVLFQTEVGENVVLKNGLATF